MIIDFHTHIFPDEVTLNRDSFLYDPAYSMLYAHEKSRMAGAADLVCYMSESAVDHCVAMSFPWHDAKACSIQNDYMAEVMQEHGGRLSCFGMVSLKSDNREITRQVRAIKYAGLTGIGELGFYAEGFTPFNAGFTRHLIEAAAAESLPVCIHLNEPVGHNYSGKYQPRLDELYTILSECGEAKVILSHWGGGLFMYELMPEVKETLKNVWYDTAATPYLYSEGIYDAAITAAGADKIIFGSDFPLLGISRYTGAMDSLTPAVREKIMSSNAAGILGI